MSRAGGVYLMVSFEKIGACTHILRKILKAFSYIKRTMNDAAMSVVCSQKN